MFKITAKEKALILNRRKTLAMEQPIEKTFIHKNLWQKEVLKITGKKATAIEKMGSEYLKYMVGEDCLSLYRQRSGKAMISTDGHHETGTYIDLMRE